MGFVMAISARNLYTIGEGDYESSREWANEMLGLPKEDPNEATKRTLDMVAGGWIRR